MEAFLVWGCAGLLSSSEDGCILGSRLSIYDEQAQLNDLTEQPAIQGNV